MSSVEFLEGLIVHRVVGIARHESRVDHLSIVSIGEKGPPRVLYLPRNPGSFAVNRLIDTSRVPGRTQGGSLRAIDHWLVARTNNGSRYRSIFPRMTWWIYSPTIAHTGGNAYNRRSLISRIYVHVYVYTWNLLPNRTTPSSSWMLMPIFFEIAAAPNSINAFSLFRYDDRWCCSFINR